jgi:hypothetical protein
VRLEVLGQLKNSMTSSGIEAATFRLVAQCLDQLRYRGALKRKATVQKLSSWNDANGLEIPERSEVARQSNFVGHKTHVSEWVKHPDSQILASYCSSTKHYIQS